MTFGICEKLSKNGRFSRYNLGKFVIFENWLVNWIMLNYIAYLLYFVKIEIKRSSSQKKKFIGWKAAQLWLVNSPYYINRNIKKLLKFSIENKIPIHYGFTSTIAKACFSKVIFGFSAKLYCLFRGTYFIIPKRDF